MIEKVPIQKLKKIPNAGNNSDVFI